MTTSSQSYDTEWRVDRYDELTVWRVDWHPSLTYLHTNLFIEINK